MRTSRSALVRQVEELRSLVEALQEERATDIVTGVRSRRYLTDRFSHEKSERRPCALIVIDVDHFKRVNDEYGHDVGDTVLRSIGQALCTGVRLSDDVGRWGGEEFLVLCPNTDVSEAAALAERLRLRVEGLCWSFAGTVTVSAGVAGRSEVPGAFDDALKQADEAMYVAKNSGRNRVATQDSTVLEHP